MDRLPSELDRHVAGLKDDPGGRGFDALAKEYRPLIVSAAAKRLNRYVRYGEDPAYAVALEAFYKAVLTYDPEKGGFIGYAQLLMDRALINFLKKEAPAHESLEDLQLADPATPFDETLALRDEIQALEQELHQLGITFDDLVEDGPKHVDTRANARELAVATQKERPFVEHLYKKKRLPVTEMCRRYHVSRKVVYGSSSYIIAVIVVLEKQFEGIKKWI